MSVLGAASTERARRQSRPGLASCPCSTGGWPAGPPRPGNRTSSAKRCLEEQSHSKKKRKKNIVLAINIYVMLAFRGKLTRSSKSVLKVDCLDPVLWGGCWERVPVPAPSTDPVLELLLGGVARQRLEERRWYIPGITEREVFFHNDHYLLFYFFILSEQIGHLMEKDVSLPWICDVRSYNRSPRWNVRPLRGHWTSTSCRPEILNMNLF